MPWSDLNPNESMKLPPIAPLRRYIEGAEAHHEDEFEGEVGGEQRHVLHVLIAAGAQAAARRAASRSDVATGAWKDARKPSATI